MCNYCIIFEVHWASCKKYAHNSIIEHSIYNPTKTTLEF